MKYSTSVGGIVRHKNKILMIEEQNGFCSFPKGHTKKGEKEIETARREIEEETGLTELTAVKRLGSYKRHPFLGERKEDKEILKTIIFYLFEALETEFDPGEDIVPFWVDKEDVLDRITHLKEKEFFKKQVYPELH